MVAPLFQCTKEEPRAVIRFMWSERVKTVEIHRRMLFQYVNSCLAQRKVYECMELFRNGRKVAVDKERPCRPRTGYGQYLNITIGPFFVSYY